MSVKDILENKRSACEEYIERIVIFYFFLSLAFSFNLRFSMR